MVCDDFYEQVNISVNSKKSNDEKNNFNAVVLDHYTIYE